MEKRLNSIAWFPRHPWSAKNDAIIDQEFFDFDQQAERLTGHDQDYMQLSEGGFHGRFVSCFLGTETSLHIERANQALSQNIAATHDSYSIGVVLSAPGPFRANGSEVDTSSIFVIPPSASFHLSSPKEASVMAFVIGKEVLHEKLQNAPHVRDWITELKGEIGCLHAPNVAARLRQDAQTALLSLGTRTDGVSSAAWLGDALINSFVANLILEWNTRVHPLDTKPARSFHRFLEIKSKLDAFPEPIPSIEALSNDLTMSKRSIQYAFSNELSLGVSCYLRRVRLHSVRRDLLTSMSTSASIGDLAAQHGFWNWSHFSRQYRQLFGERPSDTRLRSLN